MLKSETARRIVFDVALGVGIFLALLALQPRLPDGDGLSHAAHAIFQSFHDGMRPKHPLYAAVMRCVYLAVDGVGLRPYTLVALAALSHLAAVGSFFLLLRGLLPPFLGRGVLNYACCFGFLFSYGVLSRAAAIESYSLAVFFTMASVAVCELADLTYWRNPVLAGVIAAMAVCIHVTCVLSVPFLVLVVWMRSQKGFAVRNLAAACLTAGLLLCAVYLFMGLTFDGGRLSFDVARIVPDADAAPPHSLLTEKLPRAAYGMLRTIIFIAPFRSIGRRVLFAYGAGAAASIFELLFLAYGGVWRARRKYVSVALAVSVLVAPFAAIGIYYYASDPERWIFLAPVFWLAVGVIFKEYGVWHPGSLTAKYGGAALLAGVFALGAFNVWVVMLPEARYSRDAVSLQRVAQIARKSDLWISPAGINGPINEFVVGKYVEFENVNFEDLVDRFGPDQEAIQQELRGKIQDALDHDRRVFTYALIGEEHVKNYGSPWSRFAQYDYGPETFMTVLNQFSASNIAPATDLQWSIYRLGSPSDATNVPKSQAKNPTE